jgi:hypothetical protein
LAVNLSINITSEWSLQIVIYVNRFEWRFAKASNGTVSADTDRVGYHPSP